MQLCHVLEKLELEHLTNGTKSIILIIVLRSVLIPTFRGYPGSDNQIMIMKFTSPSPLYDSFYEPETLLVSPLRSCSSNQLFLLVHPIGWKPCLFLF